MKRFIVPGIVLMVFAGLWVALYSGLNNDPRKLPSVLIDKPAPDFNLTVVGNATKRMSKAELLGQVYILNVWASWCIACRAEHPVLIEYSKNTIAPIYGLNYRDEPQNAERWLAQFGDPYILSMADLDARTGIDFGVYGAPETFIIDKKGIIRYKFIGPLSLDVLRNEMEPIIRQLNSEAS
ncbi:MAG: DsbE family thiol:disulfide interchange protein [bacterium]